MNRIQQAARKVLQNSKLAGKDKIALDELIEAEPDGISINAMEVREFEGNEYYAFGFAEDSGHWFTGGGDLVKLGKAWLDEFNGNIDELNQDLEVLPYTVKICKIRTKNGKTYTKVTEVSLPEKPVDLPF